ncbi:MAG: M14 family metallopeptidase [Bdellovibrionota bacterium]
MKFLLLALLSLTAHAQDPVLSSYELASPDTATLAAVAKYFDVDHARGNNLEIIVPQNQASLLLAIAPRAKLIEADTAAANQAKLRTFRKNNFLLTQNGYHSYDQVQAWMHSIPQQYPFASVVDYGISPKGRVFSALRLNNGNSPKPVLLITAATHGDELITTEVTMALVNQMLAAYGKDTRFTQMIDRHDIYIVPTLNADGFTATARYDGNADPNRSYPWPGNPTAKPTPSIAAIIKLFEAIHPVASLDFHAYGGMIMYPWAYTHDAIDSTNKARLESLTTSMAAENHYAHGPISDVIYIAQGSSADYYFWKAGTNGIAIEMGDDKIPDPSEFPAYINAIGNSTWKFVEAF